MAAYAALVSLFNDLELIPNHPTHSFSFDNKQLSSLSQTVEFLIDFMETYDSHGCTTEAAEALEGRIASAAHAAQDVIESHVVDQIHAGSTLVGGKTRSYFFFDLQKAIENMEFVKRKAMQFKAKSGLKAEQPRYSSAAPSTSSTEPLVTGKKKNAMVGFDSVLLRLHRMLIGGLKMVQATYSAPPTSTSTEPLALMQFKAKSGAKAEQPTHSAPYWDRSGVKAEQLSYSSTSNLWEPLTSGKNVMVGLDAVVHRLLNMLTGEPSDQRLVIPIVGMGGIGKTTLAKYVYESSLTKQHFDVRLWATVSYEYTVESILEELLSGENAELHKKLWGRRYLIVLDDMWSLKAWDEIQMCLPHNGNGSRVIVTTRLSNLAAHLSSSPFEMDFLDDDRSWQLFCGKAFGGEEDCPVELEEIGKKVVRRCRGLPLSIVVIGGHLRRSPRAIEYWEKVATFINPVSSLGTGDQCLEILRLSYQRLPACLKPCFLYMGVFKEDEQINASKLLRIWVAEGFVRPKTGQTSEKVAEDYLNDLIERNLILVGVRKWNGKVESCAIHDVLRELCLRICKEEKFLALLGTTEAIDRERRIVILQERLDPDVVGALKSAPSVRSLRRQGARSFDDLLIDLRSLRLLRVSANVINMLLKEDGVCLPPAHSRQLNLRYLAFSSKKLSTTGHFIGRPFLPSSISLFWNMQTLAIHNFDVQISAPYEIWEMSQLRHLEFRGFYLPDPQQQQECIVLKNLQTLVGVENLRLTEEVCKRMPNIKELSVFYDRFPDDCDANSYYCPHNLGSLSKLESLNCEFGDDSMFRDDFKWRHVVRNFTFPASLEELCLWNSNIHWEDLTGIMKFLPHLRSLKLNSVRGPEWHLDDQEFPRLRVLWISKCDDLMVWNANSSHFPVLEILRVWTMPMLKEIPIDIGEIPTLGLIELYHCSVSAAVSAMRLVMEQESCGNLDIQLELHFGETEEVNSFLQTVDEEGLKISSLQLHLP